ncbi:hypothetical protein Droror1_Dr00011679 [Drosera rotundifolia]
MNGFLKKFFYSVYERKQHAHKNNYCKNHGCRTSIICGGISFLLGAILNATAQNLAMLIAGRLMLEVGIGFGNQVVPLYLSEMAPAHIRGGLNMMFQLATTIGRFMANMINYGTEKLQPWVWTVSLGLAAAPALLMTVGGIFLPETPNSLIKRGFRNDGQKVLEKTRGTSDIGAALQDMIDASEYANAIKNPFKSILRRRNIPQLVMVIFMPAIQKLKGINSILFYAPVLFQSLGFGGNASLYASSLTSAVLVASTLLSIGTVDRLGRRALLISGGFVMVICQVIVAIVLGLKFEADVTLSKGYLILVVTIFCIFILAFGWSWGPLGWTVPSEIFPLET